MFAGSPKECRIWSQARDRWIVLAKNGLLRLRVSTSISAPPETEREIVGGGEYRTFAFVSEEDVGGEELRKRDSWGALGAGERNGNCLPEKRAEGYGVGGHDRQIRRIFGSLDDRVAPPDPRATFPAMPYSPALLKDVAEVVYLAVPPSEALI